VRLADGTRRSLDSPGGKYGAGYARVSSQRQQEDGWSQEDQLVRIVRYYLDQGLAFRIFSDAGLPGSLAYRDPGGVDHLSHRLAEKRARRYEVAYRKIFMENPAYSAHQASMEAHLASTLDAIRAGDPSAPTVEDPDLPRIGRPSTQATYRPGLTTLVESLPEVHTLAVTDLSRLSRSQILFADLVERLTHHRVQVAGLVEDLSWVSGTGDIGADIVAYVISRIAEHRLSELTVNVLRGQVTKLEAGEPSGRLPSWLSTDATGKAYLNERATVVRRIVDLALTGVPYIRIALMLAEAGTPIFGHNGKGYVSGRGRAWHTDTIKKILASPTLKGVQVLFGIPWKILPAVATEEEWDRIQARLAETSRKNPQRVNRYLASQLMRCSCGYKLTHRPIGGGFDMYVCAAPPATRRANRGVRHVAISQRHVDGFLDDLMRHDPSTVVGAWKDTLERSEIREALQQLLEERQALRALLPEAEARAREEAKGKARLLYDGDEEDDEIVSAVARRILSPTLQKLDALEREIAERQRRLESILPSDEIASIEARARVWDSLTTDAKNALLLTLFREWRFEGIPPHETVVPVLNTLDEASLPPFILTTAVKGRSFFRRFPSMGDWIESWGSSG
jgi:DNA invertase Pin-like site-specific DNA recombinase